MESFCSKPEPVRRNGKPYDSLLIKNGYPSKYLLPSSFTNSNWAIIASSSSGNTFSKSILEDSGVSSMLIYWARRATVPNASSFSFKKPAASSSNLSLFN